MGIIFQDAFDTGAVLDKNKWEINTLNGYDVILENGKLKFSATGSWCGAYVHPRVKINKNKIGPKGLSIEFDYTIGNHYSSADKPYVGFYNASKTPIRDNRYNMIQCDDINSFLIYLADNSDSSKRTKFSMAYTNKLLKTVSVNYSVGEILHIKLLLNKNKKNISMFIDNEEAPLLVCDVPNWDSLGEELIFEINSNSYSRFVEYYDNFIIKNSAEYKYLLEQENQYYSLKSEFYKDGQFQPITELNGKETLIQSDFETYGIDDLNLLTKPINIEIANGIDKGSLKSGKYFEIKLNNNFKKINDIDKISLTSITDDFSTKNNIFNVNSNDKGFYIDINDKMLKACAPDMYKNGKVTFTQKCKKIKFIYKITSKPWYVKFKIDGEESTLINTSEWNTFVKEFNEISTHNFEFYLIADGSSGWGTIYLDSITFDIPENNILMQYESQLYTLNENNIILSPLQTLDKDNFINNGFTDTDLITKDLLLNKFENLEEIKLLVYTDDLEKNKCEMIYNCAPFRPIDKLKKNSHFCNILFKEV
ncbi:hypothetical protein [Clostridium botulinum]|uniref:hypothetical protein n=1 Tax=Clostridium botulinum TaxID=1491 RepID=UPI001F402CA2|nr:hypothetical protein [Clostridium botulinum]